MTHDGTTIRRKRLNRSICGVFILMLIQCLAACTVGPDYHPPKTTMPGSFVAGLPQTQPSTLPGAVVGAAAAVDVTRWWKSLHDAELDSLIARAVTANLDLEIAFTRLQEARMQEAVVSGGSLPSLEGSGAFARGSGNNSIKSRVATPLNAATNTTKVKEITQVIGFDAGWELDLWGKYRRAMEAARADTQAIAEVRNAVLITLISDVARAYMDVRALQWRLAIALANIEDERQTADLVEARYNRGLINELDVALSQRQLASVEAQIAPLRAGILAAQRRIAVLVGQYPQELTQELDVPIPESAALPGYPNTPGTAGTPRTASSKSEIRASEMPFRGGANPKSEIPPTLGMLPQLPEVFQPGLPVELLRRRPDIRESERRLASATAGIGVATAKLYPTITLTGGLGTQGQASRMGKSLASSSFIWSVGPQAYWPLLDFGTLDALITIQDFRAREALLNYKETILKAVEEVDNAISNYAAEQDRLRYLNQALVQSQRAVSLATERYERGFSDFLDVLDAQRQLFAIQNEAATDQEAVVLQFIAVYKGLGGGWETYPPAGPPPAASGGDRGVCAGVAS